MFQALGSVDRKTKNESTNMSISSLDKINAAQTGFFVVVFFSRVKLHFDNLPHRQRIIGVVSC